MRGVDAAAWEKVMRTHVSSSRRLERRASWAIGMRVLDRNPEGAFFVNGKLLLDWARLFGIGKDVA